MSKAQPVYLAAAAGSSAMAEAYAAGPPDCPPGVIDWLGEDVGLAPGKSALDLGAGTGESLPFLRATGKRESRLSLRDARLCLPSARLNAGVHHCSQ
jgi:hypothetical protein